MAIIIVSSCKDKDVYEMTHSSNVHHGEYIGNIFVPEYDENTRPSSSVANILPSMNEVLSWDLKEQQEAFLGVLLTAMTDPKVADYVFTTVNKRFDGDYNFLLATSRTQKTAIRYKNSSLIDLINKKMTSYSGGYFDTTSFTKVVTNIVSNFPLKQIAIPLYDDMKNKAYRYDPSKIIYGAILPDDFDDQKDTMIEVFDQWGEKKLFNIRDIYEMDNLFILFSENERVYAESKGVVDCDARHKGTFFTKEGSEFYATTPEYDFHFFPRIELTDQPLYTTSSSKMVWGGAICKYKCGAYHYTDKRMEKHYASECPNNIQTCSLGCGFQTRPEASPIELHYPVCGLREQPCPNHTMGCPAKWTLDELKQDIGNAYGRLNKHYVEECNYYCAVCGNDGCPFGWVDDDKRRSPEEVVSHYRRCSLRDTNKTDEEIYAWYPERPSIFSENHQPVTYTATMGKIKFLSKEDVNEVEWAGQPEIYYTACYLDVDIRGSKPAVSVVKLPTKQINITSEHAVNGAYMNTVLTNNFAHFTTGAILVVFFERDCGMDGGVWEILADRRIDKLQEVIFKLFDINDPDAEEVIYTLTHELKGLTNFVGAVCDFFVGDEFIGAAFIEPSINIGETLGNEVHNLLPYGLPDSLKNLHIFDTIAKGNFNFSIFKTL